MNNPINIDLIISNYLKDLPCVKVGVHYGSQLYFEFGMLLDYTKNGKTYSFGLASLTLESDKWIIRDPSDKKLVNSEIIGRAYAENDLTKIFFSTSMLEIDMAKIDKAKIIFSNKYSIEVTIPEHWEDNFDSAFTIALPDGRYLTLDKPYGFKISDESGELEELRRKYYSNISFPSQTL